MNRTTRTIIKIFLIAAATVACIAAAYYLGSLITGHKLATASDNMNYSPLPQIRSFPSCRV